MTGTMKKHILTALYIFSIMFCVAGPAQAENFIFGDIPVMEDMWVGETIQVDSSSDSITNVSASTQRTQKAVLTYYQNALPNLGWVKQSTQQYKRGSETLKISLGGTDSDGTTVEFNLLSQ